MLKRDAWAQFTLRQQIVREMQAACTAKLPDLHRIKTVLRWQHQLARQLKFAQQVNAPDFWKKQKDALLLMPDD